MPGSGAWRLAVLNSVPPFSHLKFTKGLLPSLYDNLPWNKHLDGRDDQIST